VIQQFKFLLATLFVLLFTFSLLFSQKKYKLLFFEKTTNKTIFFGNKKYQTTFFDSTSAISELTKIINAERYKGFASANFDSIAFDSVNIKAYFYKGNKLIINNIYLINNEFNDDSKFKKKDFFKSNFSEKKLSNLQKNIVTNYENNGFPFASTQLNFAVKSKDTIDAILTINKNNFIQFDSLIIKGNFKVSSRFLQKFLAINKKEAYSEKIFLAIEEKINSLTFIKLTQKPEIEFTKNNANIYLSLTKKPTNSFSGIIGLLSPEKENGQFILTGDMQIFLQNTLSHADFFALNWQKYKASSQKMNLEFQYPYLFNLPLGINTSLNLNKQDSSYLNSMASIGFQYYYKSNNYIKLFYQKANTNLLKLQEENSFAQTSVNSLGLGIYYNKLDYIFNPRKGWLLESNFSSGKKTINSASSSLQYKFENNLSIYLPIFKQMTIHIQNYSGILENSHLFLNELFRLGGLQSLKGFDDESIFASSFSAINFELKYLFEENSNFLLFCNQLFYNQKLQQTISDKALGFGAGFNFQTKAGIFSLVYALGKQQNQTMQLKNAKIHFGYINRF